MRLSSLRGMKIVVWRSSSYHKQYATSKGKRLDAFSSGCLEGVYYLALLVSVKKANIRSDAGLFAVDT